MNKFSSLVILLSFFAANYWHYEHVAGFVDALASHEKENGAIRG